MPYARDKEMGGSSTTNFMIYTPWFASNFNRWAWDVTKEWLRQVNTLLGRFSGPTNHSPLD
jgi:hypothetical protein